MAKAMLNWLQQPGIDLCLQADETLKESVETARSVMYVYHALLTTEPFIHVPAGTVADKMTWASSMSAPPGLRKLLHTTEGHPILVSCKKAFWKAQIWWAPTQKVFCGIIRDMHEPGFPLERELVSMERFFALLPDANHGLRQGACLGWSNAARNRLGDIGDSLCATREEDLDTTYGENV